MAETNGLLNRRTGKSGTEGSNPSVSARTPYISEPQRTKACFKKPGFLRHTAEASVRYAPLKIAGKRGEPRFNLWLDLWLTRRLSSLVPQHALARA